MGKGGQNKTRKPEKGGEQKLTRPTRRRKEWDGAYVNQEPQPRRKNPRKRDNGRHLELPAYHPRRIKIQSLNRNSTKRKRAKKKKKMTRWRSTDKPPKPGASKQPREPGVGKTDTIPLRG